MRFERKCCSPSARAEARVVSTAADPALPSFFSGFFKIVTLRAHPFPDVAGCAAGVAGHVDDRIVFL
jgi:hypothetical protein